METSANLKVLQKTPVKRGFHLADWNLLLRSLPPRGAEKLPTITKEELSQHNSKYDAWVAYNGVVYNITQYSPYHPGGESIILETAGTDCTELFNKYHKWVNIKALLGKHVIGNLEVVESKKSESITEESAGKEEMSNVENVVSTTTTIETDEKEDKELK
jgi:cytochrome b involved in lipid metabolism